MMGIFAPVVTEVCLTNPWTGLFSGEDLSIPGGVKPKWTHNIKHICSSDIQHLSNQRLQTGKSAELIRWGYSMRWRKVAECDVAGFLTRSNISPYIIDVT